MGEVRYGAQAAPARLGSIPAALQPIDVGRDLGGQRAFEQPGLQDRVQFRDQGHDDLQWWSRRYCTRNRFMSSAARRRHTDRERCRCLLAYAI